MLGTIEVSIWRNDVYMLTVNRKENEVNDFIIKFLSSFNDDDGDYEIVGTNKDGYCVIDLYGTISTIHKCIDNDKPFNI